MLDRITITLEPGLDMKVPDTVEEYGESDLPENLKEFRDNIEIYAAEMAEKYGFISNVT